MASQITLRRKAFTDSRLKEYAQCSECSNPNASFFCCLGLGILEIIVRGKCCLLLNCGLANEFRTLISKYYDFYESCKLLTEFQTISALLTLLESVEYEWTQLMEWLIIYMFEDRDCAASSLFKIIQGLIYNIVTESNIKDEIFSQIPLKKKSIETIANSLCNVFPIHIRIFNKENNNYLIAAVKQKELPVINLAEDKMNYFLLYHEEVVALDNNKVSKANLFRPPFTFVPMISVEVPKPVKEELQPPSKFLGKVPESRNNDEINRSNTRPGLNNPDQRPPTNTFNTNYNPPQQIINYEGNNKLLQVDSPIIIVSYEDSQKKLLTEAFRDRDRQVFLPEVNLTNEKNSRPESVHEAGNMIKSHGLPPGDLKSPQIDTTVRKPEYELPQMSENYLPKNVDGYLRSKITEKPIAESFPKDPPDSLNPPAQRPIPSQIVQVPIPSQLVQGPIPSQLVQGPIPSQLVQGPIPSQLVQGPIIPQSGQGLIPPQSVQEPIKPPPFAQSPYLAPFGQGRISPKTNMRPVLQSNEKPLLPPPQFSPMPQNQPKFTQQNFPMTLPPQPPGPNSSVIPPPNFNNGLPQNQLIIPPPEENFINSTLVQPSVAKLHFPTPTPVNTNKLPNQPVPNSRPFEQIQNNLVVPPIISMNDGRRANTPSFPVLEPDKNPMNIINAPPKQPTHVNLPSPILKEPAKGSIAFPPQSSFPSSISSMNVTEEKKDAKISQSLKGSKHLIDILQVFATTIKKSNAPITKEVLDVVRNAVDKDSDLLNIPEIKEFYDMDSSNSKNKVCIKCKFTKESEEFNIISCPSECSLCSYCRIFDENFKCSQCLRSYSEYEVELLMVIKASL